MKDQIINKEVLAKTIQRCRERNIIIPTYKQMRNPELIPEKIKEKLRYQYLHNPRTTNLFRH